MRNLILLRGAAGCGKSTWIKNNHLSQYTIAADDIRLLFQSPITNVDGHTEISQKNDGKVWEFIFHLLEERMSRGELTIVDATHSRVDLINRYKKICQEYRYRCTVVKFDIPLEIVLSRNSGREEHKRVPADAIENMVARINSQPTPNWCKEISYEDFWTEFEELKPFDFNQYERIVHIGDLHGCFEPLQKFFEEYPYNENWFYIFLGDYVDRGIQHKELLEFLFEFKNKKNVLLLEGNHEIHLKHYGNDKLDKIRSREFLRYTIPQLESLDKKEIREFCRRLGQFAYYEYHGNIVFCNHGGFPILPTPFTATEEIIKGVGKYEQYLKVEETWNDFVKDECTSAYWQIHGHRNTENTGIKNGYCFNLCDTVEFGGYLRIVMLDNMGFFRELKYKNNTFFINETPPEKLKIEDEEQLLQAMLHNKLIRVKDLGKGIVSLNFTREAFYDKKWNDVTTKARGLFVNLNNKKIVARAWDKMFSVEDYGK